MLREITKLPKETQIASLIFGYLALTIVFVKFSDISEVIAYLRIIFGLPLVLFVPGYMLVSALFPKKEELDSIERIALGFGLSIAVVPLLGLLLNFTPWGIRLDPILVSLVTATAFFTIVSLYRQKKLITAN